MKINRLKLGFVALLGVALSIPQLYAVKIGVLHSLSGTMAISETSLKDVVMMAVKEINESAECLERKWKQSLWTRRLLATICRKSKTTHY